MRTERIDEKILIVHRENLYINSDFLNKYTVVAIECINEDWFMVSVLKLTN